MEDFPQDIRLEEDDEESMEADSTDEEEDGEGEEEGGGGKRPKEGPPEWYDEKEDDDAQRWVHRQRRSKTKTSDAILSCPACFTTVCLECQRHQQYTTQYRAMSTLNCRVMRDEVLTLPSIGGKGGVQLCGRKRGRGKRRAAAGSSDDQCEAATEEYHSVQCDVCRTEVAVLDREGVYHFFNVLPSFG